MKLGFRIFSLIMILIAVWIALELMARGASIGWALAGSAGVGAIGVMAAYISR